MKITVAYNFKFGSGVASQNINRFITTAEYITSLISTKLL